MVWNSIPSQLAKENKKFVRISMADYKAEDRIVNLSLYAVEEICRA